MQTVNDPYNYIYYLFSLYVHIAEISHQIYG